MYVGTPGQDWNIGMSRYLGRELGEISESTIDKNLIILIEDYLVVIVLWYIPPSRTPSGWVIPDAMVVAIVNL